jgi:DNA polymerase-3 subunit alpha
MGACEATGLLKMDFLGLRNLSVLDDALLNIKANKGVDVVLEDLTLDDKKTFELLSRGDTLGVFQLDGGPMRALLRSMSPDSFQDISAVIALYRPGPMGDQEQVMAIAQKVAGFSLGRADLLRKAMGKKNKEILDKEYVPFEAGMKTNGFGNAAIKRLWDVLIPFSDYAFNRAHSAGYGVVSYWTAYLKANYPTEYMAALLTSVRDDKDKSALYLSECRRMGIQVLPPDVNESDAEYTPRGTDIRFGLAAIRNVGEGVVASIKSGRDAKGRYQSFGDFLAKVDAQVCNKKTIESLIKAGAFDSLGHTRKGLMAVYLEAIDSVIETKRAEAIGQFDLFGGESATSVSNVALDIPEGEWEKAMLLSYEREMLGLYVSDHPLLGVEHVLRAGTDMSISELLDDGGHHDQIVTIGGLITSVTRKVTRQGASWAVVTIEDLEGSLEALFFSNTYNQYALTLTEDRIVLIRGRVDKREDQVRFTALEMKSADVSAAPTGPLVITLPINQCTPPVVDRMKEILRSHPGKREVHLHLDENGMRTVMKLETLITSSPSLSADLKSILGPNCLQG